MHPRRMFRPDLDDRLLEDRLASVVPNLGVIVLTTGGYMLMIPFPGAYGSLGPGFADALQTWDLRREEVAGRQRFRPRVDRRRLGDLGERSM